jgi:hypothetical protein
VPDMPALREALGASIAADKAGLHRPEVWVEQVGWGTAACLFGRRALLDGYQVVENNLVEDPRTGEELGGDWRGVDWEEWGARRFQIDLGRARLLAHADNTLAQLKELIDGIEAGLGIEALFAILDLDDSLMFAWVRGDFD